jgi:hypothetical protein
VHHAGRVTDVQVLDLHAHVDEQGVSAGLQEIPALPGREVFHAGAAYNVLMVPPNSLRSRPPKGARVRFGRPGGQP